MTVLKQCFHTFLYLWLIICLAVAFMMFEQIWDNRTFVKEKLIPPKEFIEQFKLEEGRIPTLKEFETMYVNSDDIDYSFNRYGEYKIEIWRGEWNESYTSKTNTFNPEPWEGGFVLYGIITLLIGIIPILLYRYFGKKYLKSIY